MNRSRELPRAKNKARADSQQKALGFPSARVFVPHPIQDRTDDEMRALADGAIEQLVSALTAG